LLYFRFCTKSKTTFGLFLRGRINLEPSCKPSTLEKYDIQFKVVFDPIRELMVMLDTKKKRTIGFAPWEKK